VTGTSIDPCPASMLAAKVRHTDIHPGELMEVCHRHNRRAGLGGRSRRFGLKLSLPLGDPMRTLLGDDWHEYQWFDTQEARERKLEELLGPFAYYRKGDRPTFTVERVEQDAASEDTGKEG
jgi:hypothetical protein